MNNTQTDKFNLTKTDYDNVLTAIKNVYGQDAATQYDNPFSDTDVEYNLIDMYPNSDIGTIDDKFFNFFQDLMNNFGADLEEGFDRDMWVNADDHDEYITVADIYNAVKTQYPKY